MKKGVWQTVSLLLAAGMLVQLMGCKEPTVAVHEETLAQSPTDSLQEEKTFRQTSSGTEEGAFLRGYGAKQNLMVYIDYASCEQKILCKKPNCSHDTKECLANLVDKWLLDSAALDRNTAAFLVRDIYEDKDKIILASRSEESPRILMEVSHPIEIQKIIAVDEDFLYVIAVEDMEAGKELQSTVARISRTDGRMEHCFLLENHQTNCMGVWGRDLLLKQIQNEGKRDLLLKNVDTGEETKFLHWEEKSNMGWGGAICAGETIYWTNNGLEEELHWKNRQGQEGALKIQWPKELFRLEEPFCHYEQILNGKLLVLVTQQNNTIRYAVDLKDGSVTPVTLSYVFGGVVPVNLIANNSNEALILFEESEQQQEQLDEAGVPQIVYGLNQRIGVLSFEDFFASRPDYREIETW